MMTRKLQRYVLAGLLIGLATCALELLYGQQARGLAAGKHCLWRIQNQQNTVYLLGSIHVLKDKDYPLPQIMESAFTNARIAVFETDIDALDNPEVLMKIAMKGRLPEGQTLKTQLSPATYAALNSHIQKAGLPTEMFESITPAMAAITLVAVELKKMGLDPQNGLDKHYFTKARERNMKVVPLETIDFQLGLMTDFSKEEGELLVKSTLKEIDTMEKELDEMLNGWKTGDDAKLNKLLNEAMEESPVIYKRLLTDRNQRWLPKIQELCRGKENAIVIVGAGHLVGTNGVVQLLRKQGLKVLQE